MKTDVLGNWTILTTTFVQNSQFSVQLAHRLSINREQNDQRYFNHLVYHLNVHNPWDRPFFLGPSTFPVTVHFRAFKYKRFLFVDLNGTTWPLTLISFCRISLLYIYFFRFITSLFWLMLLHHKTKPKITLIVTL